MIVNVILINNVNMTLGKGFLNFLFLIWTW